MIEIQLTQGQVALVDECDADLAELNWYASWSSDIEGYYAARNIGGKGQRATVLMHRVILSRMLGRELLRSELVDHTHHNTLDNRRSEIRLCNNSRNHMNMKKRSDNRSGYVGVGWNSTANKWRSRIKMNGKEIHLGLFSNVKDAALAYNAKAIELFGDFAQLNEVE